MQAFLVPMEALVFFKHAKSAMKEQDISRDGNQVKALTADEIIVSVPSKLPNGFRGEEIQFAVSADKEYSCLIDRTMWHPDTKSMTMTGYLSSLETPTGTFLLTCGQKDTEKVQCIGNIRPDDTPQIQYELRSKNDGFHTIKPVLKSFYDPPSDENHVHMLEQHRVSPAMNAIDVTEYPQRTGIKRTSRADKETVEEDTVGARRLTDTNNILDVFFVYTPEAVAYFGGETAIQLACDLTVAESNVVFENSLIDLRMRSVGSMLVLDDSNFVEPNDMYDLLHVATSYSGTLYALLHPCL